MPDPAPRTQKVSTRKISDWVLVRVGYDDGHVEIDVRAKSWLPAVTLRVEPGELPHAHAVFEEAMAHLSKVKR